MRVIVLFALLAVARSTWIDDKLRHSQLNLPTSKLRTLCSLNSLDRLKEILSNVCVVRVVDTDSHRAVREYIVNRLRNIGYQVDLHSFLDYTPDPPRGASYTQRTFTNIIATQDPSSNRRLTLVCHYDSKLFDNFVFEAATDSAFPCTAMIDTAESLQPYMSTRAKKDVSLQLLFLDGEEAFVHWTSRDSIYGARKLAEKWQAESVPNGFGATQLDRMDLFVLLDLLGARGATIPNYSGVNEQKWFELFRKTEDDIRDLSCTPATNRIFQKHDQWGGVSDDHLPFQERGVPILHLIPTPFPTVWHNEHDKCSNLDDNTMLRWTAILRAFTAKYLHLKNIQK